MSARVIFVCLLALLIDLISTLAYSVRIVGVRTHRIALSFALFNIMVLVARAANAFEAPLLAKSVELSALSGSGPATVPYLRLVLLCGTVATILGALLIPSFQRLFTLAVSSYARNSSFLRLIRKGFGPAGRRQIIGSIAFPSRSHLRAGLFRGAIPAKVLLANVVVVAFGSSGTLAALYAGMTIPQLRMTAVALTSAVNGVATFLLYVFVDPYLANLTDTTVAQDRSQGYFRRCVRQMVGTRVVGTIAAQLLLIPAALLIGGLASAL